VFDLFCDLPTRSQDRIEAWWSTVTLWAVNAELRLLPTIAPATILPPKGTPQPILRVSTSLLYISVCHKASPTPFDTLGCAVKTSPPTSRAMMNGGDIKKQALNQAKKVATAAANTANGSNGQKKRRKGENLKPIITTDGPPAADAPLSSSNNPAG
jgi:hypothetical protein